MNAKEQQFTEITVMSDGLEELIRKLGRPRVWAVGDVMLDRYTVGTVERISPEGPVPVLKVTEQHDRLGGAAAVAAMLRALEADVLLLGVSGDDEHGEILRDQLHRIDLDDTAVIRDGSRMTTVKHRYMGAVESRYPQQLFRADIEGSHPLSVELEVRLLTILRAHLGSSDILLVSDYAKGVCTRGLACRCVEFARASGRRIVVDPARETDYEAYVGCNCLTPNRKEIRRITGLPVKTPQQGAIAGEVLLQRLQAEAVVVTLTETEWSWRIAMADVAIFP